MSDSGLLLLILRIAIFFAIVYFLVAYLLRLVRTLEDMASSLRILANRPKTLEETQALQKARGLDETG